MLEFILKPWHLIVLFMASQINREQQGIIEYLHVENQALFSQERETSLANRGTLIENLSETSSKKATIAGIGHRLNTFALRGKIIIKIIPFSERI